MEQARKKSGAEKTAWSSRMKMMAMHVRLQLKGPLRSKVGTTRRHSSSQNLDELPLDLKTKKHMIPNEMIRIEKSNDIV